MYSPELQAKITLWRSRAAAGTLTADEMREAVIAMRQGRVGAAVSSEKSRTRKTAVKAEAPSADDLLNELGEL